MEQHALFTRVFAQTPIPTCLIGLDRRLLHANDAMCQLLGRDRDELIGHGFHKFTLAEDLEVDLPLIEQTLAGERDSYETDKRYVGRDGSVILARLFVSLLRDEEGNPESFIAQGVDRTAAQRLREELSEDKSQMQAILDNTPMAIYLRDLDERWLAVNTETARAAGKEPEEMLGKTLADVYPAELVEAVRSAEAEVLASGEARDFDNTAVDARTGEVHHWWTHRFPIRDEHGEIVALGGVTADVTERERTQRELASSRALFEAAFEHGTVAKIVSRLLPDGTTEIQRCNEMVTCLLGWDERQLLGRPGTVLLDPEDTDVRDKMLAELTSTGQSAGELRMMHRSGYPVWVLVATALVDLGDEQLLVMQAQDITERRSAEKRLQHMADHDSLTGLLNRRRLDEELSREIARARRHQHDSCLLLLDLDGFKDVNDTLGHGAGDELLQRIADALTDALREEDVVARMGGDEFAVILPNTGHEGGLTVAEKLVGVVRYHGISAVGRVSRSVSASIGMTVIEGASAPSEHTLMAEADAAMYEAKHGGKSQVVVHVPRSDADLAA